MLARVWLLFIIKKLPEFRLYRVYVFYKGELQDEFAFIFNIKDVPMLKKNEEAADDIIEKNAFAKKK